MNNFFISVHHIPERNDSDMNLEKIVCNCLGVTNGAIKDAVEAGANTLEEVQNVTGAGTVCGACVDDVSRLIEFFAEERDKLRQK